MIRLLCAVVAAVLVGCSSPPEKVYEVNRYQQVVSLLMAQADRARQLERYDQANAAYQQAEQYARKRHDLNALGIAQLKRAAIALEQKRLDDAKALITSVEGLSGIGAEKLAGAVTYLQAKLAHHQGESAKADRLLAGLQQQNADNPEKHSYYRIVRWAWLPESVSEAEIEQDLLLLDALVAERKLNNIEIYSFALYHRTKWLAQSNDERFGDALKQALDHFASIELAPRIRDCYQLAQRYYARNGNAAMASQYQKLVSGLSQK